MKTLRWVLSSIFILSPIFCDFPTVYKFQDELTTHCVITNETESSAAVIIANESVLNATVSVEDEDKICDISINITCAEKMFKRIWKSDLSDNYDLLPITDRRWENLPLIHSQYKRKFINIFNITDGEYFNINFSVKIKSDAYILLCDGQIPYDSNCYWIIIGGRDGGKSAFQKCTTEKVSRLESKFPKSLTYYEHTDIPLNPRTWMNFTLNKTNNNYTIKSIDGEEKTILTYTEDADKINTRFVFIGSSFKNPGLWKIHGTEKIWYTGEPYRIKKKIENNVGWYSFSAMASETHIFLCKGSYGVMCYKIEIKRNEKPKVCILHKFESCKGIGSEGMKSSTNWVHFTLQIKNNNYNVISHDNVTLAHFHDATFTPQHIFISNAQRSSWNMHSYGILVSNNNGEETIDLKLRGKNGDVVCVAVFVYSCTNCNITLILQDKDNKTLSHYDQKKKNVWEEVKLKGILTTDSPLKLTTKVETQNGERAFLGDITDCSRNIRILSTHTKGDQKATCHFLKFPEVQQNIIEQSIKVFASVGNRSNVVCLKNNQSRFTELEIRVRYKGCDLHEGPYNIKIKENFVKLEALLVGQLETKPYATYRFFSQQSKHKPIADYDAPGTEHPTNEEISQLTCKQDGNKIILGTASNDCQLIRGPLYCHIQIKCSNEWCDRLNKLNNFTSKDFITQKSQVILTDPYVYGLTNYTITVGVGRNETTARTMTFKRIFYINTTPLAPPCIDNVTVFSKTNTSISIRWEKPYPPGGILEKFVIEYKKYNEMDYGNISVGTESSVPTSVTYICATINKLVPDFQYDIKVKAKNKGVDELCNSKLKSVKTGEIVPTAPDNCSLIWDKYLNLTVNCEYPLNGIGPIRQLQITINGNNSSFYDIPDNARHHQIQINATDYSASNISIEAKFSNFAGASNGTQNFTLSPPKMPAIYEALLTTRDKILYLNKLHIENVDGNSSLFVYGFNRSTKLNLMGTCDDFSILNKEMSTYYYSENLTYENRSEEIQLIENFEMTSNTNFIVFVKNSFAKFDRCVLHSQIPISELKPKSGGAFPDDKTSVIGWIVAGLLLIGMSSGIVFYMYKKEVIVYRPGWLPTSFTPRSNEPTLTPLVTQKVISGGEFKPHLIKVEHFQRYVTENQEEIKNQYNMIEALDVKPHTTGMLTNNIKKNRYKNIIAYDDTRVVLDPLYSNLSDDYINANYIKGFKGENCYIATQAPTAVTLGDFWNMVWQQNVERIVMLTRIYENGKKKCEPYYPDEEKKMLEVGGFQLSNRSTTTNGGVIITQLSVSYNNSHREITHMLYTGWLDKDVPVSTQGIIEVLHEMKRFQHNNKPIVIHCSAGVGRTGTLILCDIASKMAEETGTIDMFSITKDLRQQRTKMVQTLDQYIFAHQVVMHATAPAYQNLH